MAWYPASKKPPRHESVLGMTDLNVMIEVTWSGKVWLDLHAQNPLKIKFWRKLPAFDKEKSIKKPKQSVCHKVSTEQLIKVRHLRRVTYDKVTGRMQCI